MISPSDLDPNNFPERVTIRVNWGDMDAFGHVNNTVFFRYFEIARIRYLEKLNFLERGARNDIGPILATANCRFLQPLAYPDKVVVYASATGVKRTSFTMQYAIVNGKQELAALGDSVIVSYDYRTQTPIEIPRDVQQAIARIEHRE